MSSDAEVAVEDFESLFHGDPQDIEGRLVALRPRAAAHPDSSLAPRIESQIALVQAMQGHFQQATGTLDAAENLPGAGLPGARIQLLIERGRVSHQARDMDSAFPQFVDAWEFGRQQGLDDQAVNAAHMAAIAARDPDQKVHWNQLALGLAQDSADPKARAWITVLHNNLGQALIAAGKFPDAFLAFETCRQRADFEQNRLVERGARWGIARALRSLGHTDSAIQIQQQLLEEYNRIEASSELPLELVNMGRGLVYEELAELLRENSSAFAAMALENLGVNDWFRDTERNRWNRLLTLQRGGGLFEAAPIAQPLPAPLFCSAACDGQ
ncbi:MAG: hypothetical protein RL215_3047 [Planctomycetota bacterium]|jgi:tetratricopeptide (TPR) repeat protein